MKKDSAPGPDGIPCGVYRCAGGLGSKFLFHAYKAVLEGSVTPDCFAESRTVLIPKSSDVDNNGRIVRSPEALRPLTLCNCDCKLLASAICRGLQWYTMRCIHPSQRFISARQMTDNIFEIETTALARVPCDFAASYLSVNHSWTFHVLEKKQNCLSLYAVSCEGSTTTTTTRGIRRNDRGQFLMTRGVRQGCPGSGFLFAMTFDPFFRWLQDVIFPRNPAGLDFL